jgi:hypothetical protein
MVSSLSPTVTPNPFYYPGINPQNNNQNSVLLTPTPANNKGKDRITFQLPNNPAGTARLVSPAEELQSKPAAPLPEADSPDDIPVGEFSEKDGKNRLGFFFTTVQTAVTLIMAPAFLISAALGARGKTAYLEEMAKKAIDVAEGKLKPATMEKYKRELAEYAEMIAKGKLSPIVTGAGQKSWNPKRWFKQILDNATDATVVNSKSKSWLHRSINGLTTKVFKHPLTEQDIQRMYKLSKILLTATVFPKALNGIVYGITSQQPSMIFEYIGELLTFPFALAQTPLIQNIVFMLSGLFSLGLANDLDNDKRRAAGDKKLRVYDMTKLKSVFSSQSGLSASQRLQTLGGETWGMTKFVGEDILVGFQRIKRDIPLALQHKNNEMTNGEGNGGKASMNFALLQFGTIPKLMLSFMKNDTGPLAQAIKAYSWTLQSAAAFVGSFSIFMLGLKGETMGERVPMLGVTTESTGRIISSGKAEQPLATFLQKIGEASNSIFYAVRSNKLGKQAAAEQEKKDQE